MRPIRAPRAPALGLDGRFVVGWVGSFRRFHALDQLFDALVGIEDATLLLVGDGPERPRIELLARSRNVATVFTGTVPHDELAGISRRWMSRSCSQAATTCSTTRR